eukprot:TRINITY_DN3610_c0_g1_i1.p1 TRINITY_DN3610_c0_g1~~TRINITY_DN3610_c0_g1_i1.p1  ORF type:complete len:136 (-),score=17.19 TRINITY_DN3610_c0_g1_i1:283-690(-)
MSSFKIVANGTSKSGKTSTLMTISQNKFPGDIDTSIDPVSFELKTNYRGKPIVLSLLDTFSSLDGENTRQLSYSQTDLFLCFFSIAHRRSFSDIAEYWVPEIRSSKDFFVFLCSKIECNKMFSTLISFLSEQRLI